MFLVYVTYVIIYVETKMQTKNARY